MYSLAHSWWESHRWKEYRIWNWKIPRGFNPPIAMLWKEPGLLVLYSTIHCLWLHIHLNISCVHRPHMGVCRADRWLHGWSSSRVNGPAGLRVLQSWDTFPDFPAFPGFSADFWRWQVASRTIEGNLAENSYSLPIPDPPGTHAGENECQKHALQ